jgi:hypothetical protein
MYNYELLVLVWTIILSIHENENATYCTIKGMNNVSARRSTRGTARKFTYKLIFKLFMNISMDCPIVFKTE